ncbi:SusC/RagA family TonB-linked outer membrane protein [Chitinophagaceae bacterium LWZ2-11]
MKLLKLCKFHKHNTLLLDQTLKIMKLTAMLTIICVLQAGAKGISQNLNVTFKKAPLEKIFAFIEKESNYTFVYKYNDIHDKQVVDLNLKNATIQQVMDVCLKGQQLEYTIQNNIVAIKNTGERFGNNKSGITVKPITGIVVNEQGDPLIGTIVTVRGTKKKTVTDQNGAFTIQADAGDILEFNFIGYEIKQITVNADNNLSVVLHESAKNGDTLIVTALGLKRSNRSVTYSTQQVAGSELTKVKNTNLINSLAGKVAGLTISPNSSGVGGSAKVILRGNKSGLGSNQVLYVIDGVPMNNTVTSQSTASNTGGTSYGATTAYGGSNAYDGGDPISNLNPDDIESISVLKGASAAALYGSQGANGVILVTTKSGKTGRSQVDFSSGYTFEKAAYKPKFQNDYGQSPTGGAGQPQSWGAKITNGRDNTSDFFQTGENLVNSISLSAGGEKMQTYFSYANTAAKGIEPGNKLSRNNINLRETGRFFNDKLTVDANVNYVNQKIDNTPLAGLYFNPLTGLYLFPRGVDITQYKNTFEKLDPVRNINLQNWPISEDVQQNPWWIINRNPNSLTRNRILINGSVKYDVLPWLNIQARGSIDRISDVYEQKVYAGTIATLAPANGAYTYRNSTNTQQYADVLANLNTKFGKFKLTGLVGTSIRDVKTNGNYFASGQDGLNFPNVFTIQNFKIMNPLNSGTLQERHSQWQSVFASANLSYKDFLYLDLTARNDWASNLAFTPNESYFYPSAGLNLILSQVLSLPSFVSFAKLRGSYAEVGNSPEAYQSNPAAFILGPGGTITRNTSAPFTALMPEKTYSTELGTEWRFFNNRLKFDFTYYKTNTKNQTLQLQASQATLYQSFYVNAGNIQNQGIEIMLGYDVLKSKQLNWNTSLNYSMNKNKVIELAPGVPFFTLSGQSGANYISQFGVGGSYGDIYGAVLQKDTQGRVMIDNNGNPIKQGGDFVYLGNPNPLWQLGWNNNFTYNNFSFSFLIDGKFGGKVMSVTQAMLDQYGVSKVSGDARNAGGVAVNGVDPSGKAITMVDAQKWYTTIGGREAISGEYMYSATVVRLREAALGYSIPIKKSVVKSLKLSLIGRNLLYFSKKAPFDPEVTMSTGNGMSGIDVFMPPATRSFGLSLHASF